MTAPPLIDSHCHLAFDAFDEDRGEVLARAREAGLVGLLAVAVDGDSARAALALAAAEPGFVHATAGIHPTEAAVADPAAFDDVATLVREQPVVAVGETGLDSFHDRTGLDDQRASLERHLALALETDRPVVLHCRDAFAPLQEALDAVAGSGLRGVLHCYTGGPEELGPLLDAGLHIGIGGIATFPRNEALREALRLIPDERLLLETDAPWLAPVPRRGRRNEPAYVAHVAARVAAERGQPLEELARRTTRNARELFGLAGDRGAAPRGATPPPPA